MPILIGPVSFAPAAAASRSGGFRGGTGRRGNGLKALSVGIGALSLAGLLQPAIAVPDRHAKAIVIQPFISRLPLKEIKSRQTRPSVSARPMPSLGTIEQRGSDLQNLGRRQDVRRRGQSIWRRFPFVSGRSSFVAVFLWKPKQQTTPPSRRGQVSLSPRRERRLAGHDSSRPGRGVLRIGENHPEVLRAPLTRRARAEPRREHPELPDAPKG